MGILGVTTTTNSPGGTVSHTQITTADRKRIQQLLSLNRTQADIARTLGVHPATISREVKRNSLGGVYCATQASTLNRNRRRRQAQERCKITGSLRIIIEELLAVRWSPKIIAKMISPGFSISHETIYRWIYRNAQRGSDLWKCLIRPRKHRKKKGRKTTDHMQIPEKTHYSLRPAAAGDRSEYGHFEGDLIMGTPGRGKDCLLVLVDRKTRHLNIRKIPDRKAATVDKAIRKIIHKVPKVLRKSLTLDNGVEFTHHLNVTKHTGLPCYFTDIRAPWQRATGENRNGLIRAIDLPRGADLAKMSLSAIRRIEQLINHRPMECLGLKTPAEARAQEFLSIAFQS